MRVLTVDHRSSPLGDPWRSALKLDFAKAMQTIANAEIGSNVDIDHGEGWVTFSWLDADGIDRSLTIDIDGFCSREMPSRSGMGVTIASVTREQVRLRFTPELAAQLDLNDDVEFEGHFAEDTYADLLQLAEYF